MEKYDFWLHKGAAPASRSWKRPLKPIPHLHNDPLRRREWLRGITRSHHDQVARTLAGEILSGALAPGTKLAEAEVLERFEISRTVLREVMKTLKAKGFVAAKPRVGTTVLDSTHWNYFDADVLGWKVDQGLDFGFLSDLAEVRMTIGAAAARAAAVRRSAEDIADMRRNLAAMQAADANDLGFADADLAFRQTVARASGNRLMGSLSGVIETTLAASFQMQRTSGNGRGKAAEGHARVVDAIEAGDGEGAARAMRDIIGEGLARAGTARA